MTKARDIASAAPAPAGVTSEELGYVDGVTSAIQTQVDAKIAKTLTTTTGDIIYASSANTPARLGIGTAAQVLTVNSGATAPEWAAPAGGGKVLQVVQATTSTNTSNTTATFTDTTLTVNITPSSATSKVLVMVSQNTEVGASAQDANGAIRLMRNATAIYEPYGSAFEGLLYWVGGGLVYGTGMYTFSYLDSPATTSAITYKTQSRLGASGSSRYVKTQPQGAQSSIIALEIGA
jgi:hypothetical protein